MTTATTASSSAPAAAAAATTTAAVPTIVNQPPMSVFTRCTKTINEFLQRDPKERLAVTKRYLEPLSDVINGVPHKSVSFSVLDRVN